MPVLVVFMYRGKADYTSTDLLATHGPFNLQAIFSNDLRRSIRACIFCAEPIN